MKDGLQKQCKNCKKMSDKKHRIKYRFKFLLYDIKRRCEDPKNKSYETYGRRGIKCLITEEEIRLLWHRDKAWLLNKPSIDREDNNGNYSYSNCRFIEFAENAAKDLRVAILQYNLNGIFVREWSSMMLVERKLGFSNSHISACCKGKLKTAYKFIWKYK